MGEQRLALALRYLRLRAQLTQQAVCEQVRASGGEISTIYLSMLERGQRNPSPQMLDALLAVLDSDRAELAQLYQDEPWSDTWSSSAPRMRREPPQPTAASARTWSSGVVAISEERCGDDSLEELIRLWHTLPTARQNELLRLARQDRSWGGGC